MDFEGPLPHTSPSDEQALFLTTAIDYVNGALHLGHAYEKVIADVMARSGRSRGESVFFLTGLDEHGQRFSKPRRNWEKTPRIL